MLVACQGAQMVEADSGKAGYLVLREELLAGLDPNHPCLLPKPFDAKTRINAARFACNSASVPSGKHQTATLIRKPQQILRLELNFHSLRLSESPSFGKLRRKER